MSNGLNTEISSRLLPELSFSEFTQATVRGGVVRPRAGNVAYVPQVDSLEEWLLEQIGTNDTVRVYSANDEKEYYAYTPIDGGAIKILDAPLGTAVPLVYAAPTAQPSLVSWSATAEVTSTASLNYTFDFPDTGVDPGESVTYASAVTDDDMIDGYVSGLSKVLEVKNELIFIPIAADPLVDTKPAVGSTITNNTLAETALLRGTVDFTGFASARYGLLVEPSASSKPSTWVNSNTISWVGIVTASYIMNADESTETIQPTIGLNYTPPEPEAVNWYLYKLHTDGFYYSCGTDVVANDITEPYDWDFPFYFEDGTKIDPWPGPYDNSYLPEDVIGAFTDAKVLEAHKGCLVIAQGNIVRLSEAEQPRYFRDKFSLDAGDTVIKAVSRGEILEVHTPTDIRYIVGNAPYFELRDTEATEGPVSAGSIAETDVGTFSLFDDGIYVVEGTGRKNISKDRVTPTLEALTSPSGTVGGASKGIYYLVDTDGTGVAYDWELDEWFAFDWDTQPTGFLYSDTARALIAKISGAYQAIGNGTAAEDWAVTWREFGDGRERKFPVRVHVDADATAEILLQFLLEGTVTSGYPIDGPGEFPMPIDRAKYWSVRMSGTATPSQSAVRSVEFR